MTLLYSDSITQSEYTKNIKSDWDSKYGPFIKDADSISNYWKTYKEEKSLNRHVNIELFDIQTEDDIVKIGFRITALERPIDKVSFDYVFIEKNEKEKIREWEKYPSLNENTVRYNSFYNIKDSKIYWEVDWINYEKFKNKILEEVLQEYVFKFKIQSVKVNGVNLYESKIKIPYYVRKMWETENEFMHEYYTQEVVREFINSDFIRYNEFKFRKLDSIAREIDPRVIEFLELNVEEK